jgi:predicted SAM-dependent methyltransferase
LLNLGCGARVHPAWVNLDLTPAVPEVHRHDVCAGLPFADDSFDVVYHSHLLEHLQHHVVPGFVRECRRVLRPGGVLRLAVPDLEQICRLYLRALDSAAAGDPCAQEEHHWLVLELFDQATREQPGGAALDYLRANAASNSTAWQRLGVDAEHIRRHLQQGDHAPTEPLWRRRLRGWLLGSWRERLRRWALGPEYELLQLGRFRRGGEVHHCMYDRVSLHALLTDAGFTAFRCVAAEESAIAGWSDYHLDTLPDGRQAKPDSLYVEVHKP